MIRTLYYHFFWKRKAKKAVAAGKTTLCAICGEPIIPGDFVGIGFDDRDPRKEVLVHSGYHFSLTQMDAFCDTGAIGSAIWDGERAVATNESLLSKTFREGQSKQM